MTLPLIRVSWLEHYATVEDAEGWYDDARVTAELADCDKPIVTVGFLVRETPTHYVLADTLCANGSVSRPWMIAKAAVTERVELRPAQRAKAA